MQPTLEALRRARRDKQARRRAAQDAVAPTRRWAMPNVVKTAVLANTKSEARSAFKQLLGRPLPVGCTIVEV